MLRTGSGFREQFGAQDVAGEMLLLWVAHTEEAAANRIQELDESFEERQGGDLSGCGVAQVNASRYQEPSGY